MLFYEPNGILNPESVSGRPNMAPIRRRGRGFAGMDPERQRAIAREGGRAAHQKGTAHEFTSEEARAAGQKGGQTRGARARAMA